MVNVIFEHQKILRKPLYPISYLLFRRDSSHQNGPVPYFKCAYRRDRAELVKIAL